MTKVFDQRRWSSTLRYDPQGKLHVEETRALLVTERPVLALAPNRNSIMSILGDMTSATADAAAIAADPNRVHGPSLEAGQPHPDATLAEQGCQVRAYTVRILNQYEAEVLVHYSIPYDNEFWGAGIVNQPAMTVREVTEWVEIPTIYTVARAGGGTGREVFGVRRLERTTLYVTRSTVVTVQNFESLATYIGDAFEASNKIDPIPIIGSDLRLDNCIIRGAFLEPDPHTAALANGTGRWAYIVQYRWKAPMKALPAGTGAEANRIAIPAVGENEEIDVALDSTGQPVYKVFSITENYSSLP